MDGEGCAILVQGRQEERREGEECYKRGERSKGLECPGKELSAYQQIRVKVSTCVGMEYSVWEQQWWQNTKKCIDTVENERLIFLCMFLVERKKKNVKGKAIRHLML